MTGFENQAGFTISSTKLQVVEVNYKNDGFILENVDEAYFNEILDFESDKETKISALLQGAYNELIIKKPLNTSNVSFTLSSNLFLIAQIPYDNTLLHHDLIEEFKWELSVMFPYVQVKDLVIQYFEIDKNEIVDKNTALVIAIPRKYLKIIHNFCLNNNLKLKYIDNIHIASEKALAVNYPLTEKEIVLSVFFNNKILSIIYSLKGKLIYFKTIQVNDAGEISSYIQKETSPRETVNINAQMINEAFISGEELSASIVPTLKRTTGFDFIYFNPFEKIKPAPSLSDNKCYLEKFNSFSPAAGIAYRLG